MRAPPDGYMSANALANRWRTKPATLANLRAKGDGIPWTKIGPHVFYKITDVLAAENAGRRGFSWSRLARALGTYPGLTLEDRAGLLLHIMDRLRK
jgi:hypothetical protein